MKQTTTSLRTLFGPVFADSMCAMGDHLDAALKAFDPSWKNENTIGQTSIASAILRMAWPDSRDEMEDMIFSNHMMLQWKNWGRPTFVLSRDLYAALILTDCRGLKGSDLKPPFESFCLVLPEDNGMNIKDDDGTSWAAKMLNFTTGRTLGRGNAAQSAEMLNSLCNMIYAEGLPPTAEARADLGAVTREAHAEYLPHTTLWSCTRLFATENPLLLATYRMYHMPKDDDSLEQWLEGSKTTKGSLEVSSDDEQTLKMAHRLIANFVIYLSSHKLPAPERQSSLLKKKKQLSDQNATIYRVGSAVRLGNHLFEAARQAINRPKQKALWRLHSRFVVRGHWRNQAHGPERKERKRLWIQPFWKGPTTAEAMSRIYTTE